MRQSVFAAGLTAGIAFGAGCSSASFASKSGAEQGQVAPGQTAYPATFRVYSDAELAQRTAQLADTDPDWTILLDVFGMLHTATCRTCEPTTSTRLADVDRARVADFFSAHPEIVAFDAQGVVKKYDNQIGAVYAQVTPLGTAASIRITRNDGVLKITGHMWPNLPSPGPWLRDEDLEAKLRAMDSTPDLLLQRRYSWTAGSESGPLEIREAACLYTAADVVRSPDGTRPPERACIDARTGEDLTRREAFTSLLEVNGVVVHRHFSYGVP